MAYTFSQINQAMGQNQDQKADIFANSMANQQQGQAMPQQSQEKTSTEGDLSTAKATGGAPAYEPQKAGAAIAKKQSGRQLPGFMTEAQGQIQTAQKNLQDESNAYLQNARSQQYGVGQDILDKAGQGDQEASSQVATRLSQTAPMIESFKPKTDTGLRDVSKLQTDEGVKDYLRKQSKGQYSAGESALDLGIMKRNPQFNLIREELRRGQQELQSKASQESEARTKEAQKIASERYQQDTEGIKGALRGQADTVKSQLAQRAAEENARRQAQEQNKNQWIADQARQAYEELAANPGETYDIGSRRVGLRDLYTPEFMQANKEYEMGDRNAPQYLANPWERFYQGGGQVAPEQLANEQEAARFNNIMSLLGQQDRLQTGQGVAGPSFNKQAFQQEIKSKAQQNRAQTEASAQGVLEKLKDTGGKTLDDFKGSGVGKTQVGDYVTKADVQDAYKKLGLVIPDKYK
jgi:hypothetical protein